MWHVIIISLLYCSGNQLITSSVKLDYEEFRELVLSVAVIDDNPNHISICLITINITDINDNSPMFVNPLQFTVPENTMIGEPIGTVNVRQYYYD